MQQFKGILSTAFVAAALLTSCSAGETSNSGIESNTESSVASPSLSTTPASSESPSPSGSAASSALSTGNISTLLKAETSTESLSNGAVRKFTALGSITDLRQDQALILSSASSAPYVARVSLDSGEEEQKIVIADAEVPEGYQLTQITDAAFVGDSIVLRYKAKEGADKYNSGKTAYAFAQFSATDGNQVGKTLFTSENPLSPSYRNAPWVAGVPGESIVLTVPAEQSFSDGTAEGNVAIFEGDKEPRLQSLHEPEFNQPHALVEGALVPLSDEPKVPGINASTQVGKDGFIVLQNFNHFLVNAANFADPLSGTETATPLNRINLAQPEYINGYWCSEENKIYNLTTGESPDYGDVSCDAVAEDGTVLGRKGSKSLPVIITKDGTIIDLPSEVRGAGFMSSKYFVSGSEIYQYSIEK